MKGRFSSRSSPKRIRISQSLKTSGGAIAGNAYCFFQRPIGDSLIGSLREKGLTKLSACQPCLPKGYQIPQLTQIQLRFQRLQTILEAQMVRPLAAKQATPGAVTDRRRKPGGPEPGTSNFGLFVQSCYRATRPGNRDAPG
jgi:hypothetical protein